MRTKKNGGGFGKKTLKKIMEKIMEKIRHLFYPNPNPELDEKRNELLLLEKDLECLNVAPLTESKLNTLIEEMDHEINEINEMFDKRDANKIDLTLEELEEFYNKKQKIMNNKFIIEKLLKQIKKLFDKCQGAEDYFNDKKNKFNKTFNKYTRKEASQYNSQDNVISKKDLSLRQRLKLPQRFYDENYENYGFVPPSPSSPAPSAIPIEFQIGKGKSKRTKKRPKYFKKR